MTMDLGTLAILFPMLFLLLGLGVTVVIDPYIQQKQRRIMLLIVVLCLSLIVQNLWENELFVSHSHLALKNLLSAYGYSVRPVFLVLFLSIVWPEGKMWPAWTLAGINAALYFSSPFTKLCFEIREFDFAALVALIIAASVALDMNVGMAQQPVAFLTIAIVVGSVFYYIWLHLQFVREHEKDLMASQRIQIMMTQIQPHFLFNALNTIRALYSKDPSLADRTLEDFSTYLRQNLESLSQTDLVPVTKELEHTRLYAEIEVLRFPNIHVEYRTWDQDFQIPALTIQPLVENAIRHGVRSRKDGLVTVTTVCESGCHRITVQDNGVGFDTKKQESFAETHSGLRNVKNRIEQMCRGTMILRSEIGAGTCVTLIIPDGNKDGTREKRK